MGTTTDSAKPTLSEKAPNFFGFMPVHVSLVRVMGECRCDVYKAFSWSKEPVLLCAGNVPLTPAQIADISQGDIEFLYVQQTDYHRLQADMFENMEEIVARDDVPLTARYDLVQQVVATDLKKIFQIIRLDNMVEQFQTLGVAVSGLAMAAPNQANDFLGVARFNTDTFAHFINVSAYCVMLAKALGISAADDLQAIAAGGLLHDLGKRALPAKLLNKPFSFNEEEKRLIQSHPQKGYEELCRVDGLSFGQLMMVYQHHERIDGKGYPVRLVGDEMHPWAKICAVADVFEALTGKRPYRKPESAEKVLESMVSAGGTHFDKEMVKCWSALILRKQ